jgi:hypothetical protein
MSCICKTVFVFAFYFPNKEKISKTTIFLIIMIAIKIIIIMIFYFVQVLGIHDLFGTELAMIFSFDVGLTETVMQWMQFFFLSVSVRHFLATALPDLLF